MICSNEVLSLGGLDKLCGKLGQKDKRVCIVGGAHSAFSVAWLCSHGAAAQFSNNFLQLGPRASAKQAGILKTETPRKYVHKSICRSVSDLGAKTEIFNSCAAEIVRGLDLQEARTGSDVCSLVNTIPCTQSVREFSITILHRSPVRVFYSSKHEADLDSYRDYLQTNRHGQIHAFAGLRGDAKDMFHDVVNGREPKVRLCLLKEAKISLVIALMKPR